MTRCGSAHNSLAYSLQEVLGESLEVRSGESEEGHEQTLKQQKGENTIILIYLYFVVFNLYPCTDVCVEETIQQG